MTLNAATIAANNYLPFARTLCKTFLEHHPDGRFFVLLADEFNGAFDPSTEPFEMIELDRLDLPWGDLFLYQYSILELSTAVKPYLLRYLLDTHNLESLLYLDPDLYITAPLTSIDDALSRSSVVLTPHMFSPPPTDGKKPEEKDIMLSGVYNLGFLGVRNDKTVENLLDWWSKRLSSQCVVDPANALFVDQRWMDLAPSYFTGVEILRDPVLNVAYWNLHERKLQNIEGNFRVNGQPLGFFHFSGFNPNSLETLSKHQSRHRPFDNPALAAISRQYADELISNGYNALSKIPVAFNSISNGVRLGRLSQFVIRKAIEKGINIPSPRCHPDAFCRFLMTPNYLFDKRAIAPILVALEHYRADVKSHFPHSFESAAHADAIRNWIRSSGGKEENLSELFARYGHLLDRIEVVQHALNCWRQRKDLRQAFPKAFASAEDAEAFAQWIEQYGIVEDAFASGDGKVFLERRRGLLKPLMLYLQDQNLQCEFKFLFMEKDRVRYVQWLYAEACPRDIVSPEDTAWFDGFVEGNPDLIAGITLGHGTWLQANLVGGGTVFDLRHVRDMLSEYGVRASGNFLVKLYAGQTGRDIFAQAEQFYWYTPELQDRFKLIFDKGEQPEHFVEVLMKKIAAEVRNGDEAPAVATQDEVSTNTIKRLLSSLGLKRHKSWPDDREEDENEEAPPVLTTMQEQLLYGFSRIRNKHFGVNLTGYFHAPTGIGESVRSMSRTLAACNIQRKEIPLPSTHLGTWIEVEDLQSGQLLTSYDPANRVNIIVANGDDYPHVRSRLPYSFWKGRKNIGYWVWETENLPKSHADANGLAEIWTPSEYSAAAIRKTVDIPVRVIPHILDFEELDTAKADRARFGIPENLVAFGFFFDCKSSIERKNPHALINAFRAAFGNDHHKAVLVLKGSSPEMAPFEFSQLMRETEGLNVIWNTDALSRTDTLSLMKSLDVYVSLHRAEGFGLTLAEAMAMGKPVVASGYSGNLDFMTDYDSCLVDTAVITTERAHGPYATGTRWGEPDVGQAADYLLSLLDAQERLRVGSAAMQAIREKLNPRRVGQLVRSYLGKQVVVSVEEHAVA
jgi:glycosyltransferase involved in cell wall biosynthesis